MEKVDGEEDGAQQNAANTEGAEDNTTANGAGGENLDEDLHMQGDSVPGTFPDTEPTQSPFFGTL